MEKKDESHDQSFEDFKPQKANKKIKQEKRVQKKGTKDLYTKDSNDKTSVTACTTVVCIVCNASVDKSELECHISSCLEKYKHCNESETDRTPVGKRREPISCFICHQIITSLSFDHRQEHVNSCLNKQETKRKWEECGLNTRKKPRTSIVLDCPVCGQSFQSSEARHAHLKTCSMKHNMSTKQLIDAVRLQEKHAKERNDAGLPPVTSGFSTTVLRKSNRQKQCKPKQPKDKNEEDLQTALALSASLTETMNNETVKQLDNEHLQFTSNREECKHVMKFHPRQERKPAKRKISKSRSTPALLLRKEEERVKLLEERVSNLLNTEIPVCCTRKHIEKNVLDNTKQQRSIISDIAVNGCPLWSFSSKQDKAQNDFYVSSLRDLISPSKIKAGSKLRRLSQLPGSSLSQKLPVCTSLYYSHEGTSKSEISTQECINVVLEDEDDIISNSTIEERGGFVSQKKQCSLFSEQDCEVNANVKTSLKLAGMFRSLVGKEMFSDMLILTNYGDKHIPAHCFIFKVRCPSIIKDLKSSASSQPYLDWNDIPSDAAIAFLEVVYSGNTSLQLNNKKHIKKLIFKYNAQHLFEDLQMFSEMDPIESIFEKSDTKELNHVLSGIWQISNDFPNSAMLSSESQDTSDTDLENVYHYLSQKHCKDERHSFQETDTAEESKNFDFLENKSSDVSIHITQKNLNDKNTNFYHSSESSDELNAVCENTDEDSTMCELHVSATKTNTGMDACSLSIHSSPELFISESDTETEAKLSKSTDKLQNIDLKEETLRQTKDLNSLASLEDSPYHFSEDDNFYHEKYSSPFKRFGRKQSVEISLKSNFSSPAKSVLQKDEIDSQLNSERRTSLVQQMNSVDKLTSSNNQRVKNKRTLKKSQTKILQSSNSSSPNQTVLKDMVSLNDLNQTKDIQSQSPFSQRQILKKSNRKYTEVLNNLQNEKNGCCNENIIQYDVWDDFHDNGYNEFIADFGMNDNSYDNIIASQITERMSTSIEIAANSFEKEIEKSYELSSPSLDKEKDFLCDSPDESPIVENVSVQKENGVKQNSRLKRKICTQRNKAKVKKDITPMPNFHQMVTPELKEQCTKFGVKKLPRKKAVAVLTHIYEETHPCVKQNSRPKRNICTQRNKAEVKKDITPMPKFHQMVTPELKEQCTKFGVKKLPRKKAVAVLTHIYEETHPFVTDSEYDTSVMITPVNQATPSSGGTNPNIIVEKQGHSEEIKYQMSDKLKQPNKKKIARTNLLQKLDENKQTETLASNNKLSQKNIFQSASAKEIEEVSTVNNRRGNELRDKDLEVLSSSQKSSQSESSDMLEESLIVETECNSANVQNIHKKLQEYIQQDFELYEKILKYEPLNLTEFHKNVKQFGISVSRARLIDFLDEECITFRIPHDEKAKEKQRKRTKRYQKRRAAAVAKEKCVQ